VKPVGHRVCLATIALVLWEGVTVDWSRWTRHAKAELAGRLWGHDYYGDMLQGMPVFAGGIGFACPHNNFPLAEPTWDYS